MANKEQSLYEMVIARNKGLEKNVELQAQIDSLEAQVARLEDQKATLDNAGIEVVAAVVAAHSGFAESFDALMESEDVSNQIKEALVKEEAKLRNKAVNRALPLRNNKGNQAETTEAGQQKITDYPTKGKVKIADPTPEDAKGKDPGQDEEDREQGERLELGPKNWGVDNGRVVEGVDKVVAGTKPGTDDNYPTLVSIDLDYYVRRAYGAVPRVPAQKRLLGRRDRDRDREVARDELINALKLGDVDAVKDSIRNLAINEIARVDNEADARQAMPMLDRINGKLGVLITETLPDAVKTTIANIRENESADVRRIHWQARSDENQTRRDAASVARGVDKTGETGRARANVDRLLKR